MNQLNGSSKQIQYYNLEMFVGLLILLSQKNFPLSKILVLFVLKELQMLNYFVDTSFIQDVLEDGWKRVEIVHVADILSKELKYTVKFACGNIIFAQRQWWSNGSRDYQRNVRIVKMKCTLRNNKIKMGWMKGKLIVEWKSC